MIPVESRCISLENIMEIILIEFSDYPILEIKFRSMSKNKTISLNPYFEKFIRKEIESGRYESVDEVIRAALRLLEVESEKERELLKALKEGEESGLVEDFDPEEHLKSLHKRYL